MKRILLSLLVPLVIATHVHAEGISVSQALDKSHLTFDDSATFEITLQWPGSQFDYRFPRPLDPQFDKLRVGRFESSVSSSGTGASETTYKRFRYTLLPQAPGEGRIEPVTITYLTAADSLTGELVTEAMTVRIDPPPPPPEQRRGPSVWIWVIAVAALAAGGAAGGMALWKRRHRAEAIPERTPKEIALEQLAAARKEAGDDVKRFQASVYRILSALLLARFDIRTDELDDEKLVQAITGADLPAGVGSRLAQILVTARKDKFRPVAGAPGETLRREAEIREMLETM